MYLQDLKKKLLVTQFDIFFDHFFGEKEIYRHGFRKLFVINISGSHKLPIKKRFVRNPEKKDSDDKMLIFQGTEDDHKPSNKDWIPAPVKKGKVKDTMYYQQLGEGLFKRSFLWTKAYLNV